MIVSTANPARLFALKRNSTEPFSSLTFPSPRRNSLDVRTGPTTPAVVRDGPRRLPASTWKTLVPVGSMNDWVFDHFEKNDCHKIDLPLYSFEPRLRNSASTAGNCLADEWADRIGTCFGVDIVHQLGLGLRKFPRTASSHIGR